MGDIVSVWVTTKNCDEFNYFSAHGVEDSFPLSDKTSEEVLATLEKMTTTER